MGRVVPQKGLAVLVQAMTSIPDAMLDVCGDGWGLERVRRLVSALGMDARVEFHGWRSADELGEFYEAADVVAVPSVWPEPFGLVGIEAMRHRLPVVGSNTGGIPDWLSDRRTGRLVSPGDVRALREALAAILADPDERAAMGRRGADDVARYFSPRAFVTAAEEAYGKAKEHWMSPGGIGR